MTTRRKTVQKAIAASEKAVDVYDSKQAAGTCEDIAFAAVEASRKEPPTVHRMAVEIYTQQVSEALSILLSDGLQEADAGVVIRVAHALHGQSEIAYKASEREINKLNETKPDAVEA